MGQHVLPHLLLAFSIKDNPPYILVFVERDSKKYPQKITPKKHMLEHFERDGDERVGRR